jgi:phosphodiesterase/alkaline phosphatase D-like protein
MNTNTITIWGIVLVVLLALGGLFWYVQSNPSPAAPSTPTDQTGTQGQTTNTPGAPVTKTNQNAGTADTAVALAGSIVPNGASTDYWYEYGTTANFGSKTGNQTVGSGFAQLDAPAYISGLSKDTTYYFRLVAQNTYGQSAGTAYTFHTAIGTPAPVGSAPTVKTLAVSGITQTSANASGEVTPNRSATKYWFEYGQSTGLGQVTSVQSVGSGSTKLAASLPLANLTPGTTYYVRLNAQNDFGTVNGGMVNFKTTGTAPSATPVVTTQVPASIATTSVILRGTVNPTDLETQYWFEYSTSANFTSGTKTTPHKTLAAAAITLSAEASVTGLKTNTTYYYRMVAQSSAGTSRGESNTFTTK